MDRDIRREIGSWLKESRLKAGLTVEDAATALGVSVQTIEGFESGALAVPMKTLARAVRLYRVRPEAVVRVLLTMSKARLKRD